MEPGDPRQVDSPSSGARSFVSRVKLSNFKSIRQCDVALAGLSVLVGRNSAGKSNFLDSLRFVRDALETSLSHAFDRRGGIDEVRRRSAGHPHSFGIELGIDLSQDRTATYGFEIEQATGGTFVVKAERLRITSTTQDESPAYFERRGQQVEASIDHPPQALDDRLYLVHASGTPAYREVYDGLLSMGFYEFHPEAMKQLQSPRPRALLASDGANVASVLARLRAERPEALDRIHEYVRTIAPRITGIERVELGPKETLEYREEAPGAGVPWRFYGESMSDGMLRALGTLVAINQPGHSLPYLPLVGIEEPEMALHPAAARTLVDALHEATLHSQVILTTHSPELIDELEIPPDRLLVVSGEEGVTHIAPVDAGSLEAIVRHLSTAGELLRMDQLAPDSKNVEAQERQFELFSKPA
jgi:predicted ATPase